MPLIKMRSINKSYARVKALDNAQLSIEPGTAMALIGQNGAGKSTLIRVLTGATPCDSGVVELDGAPVEFTSPHDAIECGISTIHQEISLISQRSVAENIFLGREPMSWGFINYPKMNRQARTALSEFGVNVDVTRPLGDFNAATRQMVAIVRAVTLKAKVVIFDEASSSLDRREVAFLFDAIRKLKAAGVAVLFVSHKLDELYTICDHVTIMRDGRTVGEHDLSKLERKELVEIMLGKKLAAVSSALQSDKSFSTDTVLEANSLATQTGLSNVSLRLGKGEILGLSGLLGSGRTETAHALFGVDEISSGSLEIGGEKVELASPQDAIACGLGLCSEDRKVDGIVADMSVAENLTLALLPQLTKWGIVDVGKRNKIADTFIEKLNIKVSSRNQKIGQLSGGNQQKVLLARWLVMNLKALIVDEPTRGIDVGAKAEILNVLKDLSRDGLSVLLISSEVEEVVALADRVSVLCDGETISELVGEGISENQILATIAAGSGKPVTDVNRGAA